MKRRWIAVWVVVLGLGLAHALRDRVRVSLWTEGGVAQAGSGPETMAKPGSAPSSPGRVRVRPPEQPQFHAFVDELDPDFISIRGHITNVSVMLWASDLTHDMPGVRDPELLPILAAESGLPTAMFASTLEHYPRSDRSLPELYEHIRNIPSVAAVMRAVANAGIPFDPNSDCVLDAIRMVTGITEMEGFLGFGAPPSRAERASPGSGQAWLDALRRREAGSVRGALERAYTTRFRHRHGLHPAQVEALLAAVRPLKVYQVMAQDIHVPRPRAD